MVKISVIIPVYNSEKYLKECLDSIIGQTFTDIEIICINDGSTDDSLKILNDYADEDGRIKILSQENRGQGSARNNGLSIAKGDYIYFMDSDDILKEEALSETYEVACDKSLDFVMFKLINYDDAIGKYFQQHLYEMPKISEIVQDRIFSYEDLGDDIFQMAVSPVNKLYDRKFLTDIDVKFPEDVIFEDNVFFWKMFLKAKRAFFIHEHYYIRRRHESSTTSSTNSRFMDAFKIHEMLFDIFKENGLFERYERSLLNRRVKLLHYRFDMLEGDSKELFFNEMKNDFQKLDEDYNLSLLNKKNAYIVTNTINSRSSKELDLLIQNYSLKSKIKKIKSKNKKLKKDIKNIEGKNGSKFSKSLRNIFKSD